MTEMQQTIGQSASLEERIRTQVYRFRWGLLLLGALISGFCVILPQIGLLEWVGLIPAAAAVLVLAVDKSVSLRRMYLYGFVFFETFYVVTFHWFLYMYPLTFAGLSGFGSVVVVAVAWFGLSALETIGAAVIFPLFTLCVRGRHLSRMPFLHPFLFAVCWSAFEWFQANCGWLGVPWGRLPLGQTELLLTVESAAYLGSYFITFLLVAVNSVLACLILHPDRKKLCLTLAASLFAGNLALGGLRLLTYKDEGEPVKVAGIQGNMSSLDKWGGDALTKSEEIYRDLSQKAAADGARVIIWPETAIPYRLDHSASLREYLVDLADDCDAVILAGVFTTGENAEGDTADYNSVVAALPTGSFDPVVYNKRNPVPFGEFVPFRSVIMTLIPPLAEISMLEDDLLIGEDSYVFDLADGKVGSMICFDSIYETNALDSVRNGAQLLTVSTNDSWFRDSRGVWMHNAQSKLRAIETGRYVVRAANTGVSGVIDPTGRTREELGPLLTGYVVGEVHFNSARTLYSLIRNTFAYVMLAVMAAAALLRPMDALIASLRRRRGM